MCSFATATAASYAELDIVRDRSAGPGAGSRTATGPDGTPRQQSSASCSSRSPAARYAASSSAGDQPSSTTTLSTRTTRWRQWSNAANWPMTTSAASG